MIALLGVRPHALTDFRQLGLVRLARRAGIAEKFDIAAQWKGRDAPDGALPVAPREQRRAEPHRKRLGMHPANAPGPVVAELMDDHDDRNQEDEGENRQKSAANQAHIRGVRAVRVAVVSIKLRASSRARASMA